MDCLKTGMIIKDMRLKSGMTQKQLADKMNISDKTVSKWERGNGCPDVSLLTELSKVLNADLIKLLDGDNTVSAFTSGNMKNTAYYVCPICGNLTLCSGKAEVTCCGKRLSSIIAKKAEQNEKLSVTKVEDEWLISSSHPMKKNNYISFISFVTGDRIQLIKLYPEWTLETRIPVREHGTLMWYDTVKGLFYQYI